MKFIITEKLNSTKRTLFQYRTGERKTLNFKSTAFCFGILISFFLNTACGPVSTQTQLDEQAILSGSSPTLAKTTLPEVPQIQLDGQATKPLAELTESIKPEVLQTQPDGQSGSAEFEAALALGLTESSVKPSELSLPQRNRMRKKLNEAYETQEELEQAEKPEQPANQDFANMLAATQDVFSKIRETNDRYADFSKNLELVQDEVSDTACEDPDKECEERNPDAHYNLGVHYMNCRLPNNRYCNDSFGDDNIARELEALKHFMIAALEGHIEAQELYMRYLQYGVGLKDTFVEKITYTSREEIVQKHGTHIVKTLYEFATKEHNIQAQINLVQLYYHDDGYYRDVLREELHNGEDYNPIAEAKKFALMATRNRTPGTQTDYYSLAHSYLGILNEEEGNYRVAAHWFKQALENGNEHAHNKLENMKSKLVFIALLDTLANTNKNHEARLIWEAVPHKNAYDNRAVAAEVIRNGNYEKEEIALHAALDALTSENPDLAFQNLRDHFKETKERMANRFVEYVHSLYLTNPLFITVIKRSQKSNSKAALLKENTDVRFAYRLR